MRLGIKTDDQFLVKLNEKNEQIQDVFTDKIKKLAEKYLIGVMLGDGSVKKQETFEHNLLCILSSGEFRTNRPPCYAHICNPPAIG